MSKKKDKTDRIRSAAIVKIKYLLTTGKMDSGFKIVYEGVLSDLNLEAQEVEEYIEQNEEELTRFCLKGA